MSEQSVWNKSYIQALVGILIVVAIIALGAYSSFTFKQSKYWMSGPVIINVIGEGEVLAKPDIGSFTFTVMAEGADATQAQNLSAESMNTILAYLKEAGVEEKDIKTSDYSLTPKYTYEQRPCIAGQYCGPGEQIADGYTVYQNVIVKVRDLEQAGQFISGVGEKGATNISSLSFTIDDTDVLKAQAREMAISDAKAKADKLAEDLGVHVVRMAGFYEDEGGFYPSYYGKGGDMADSMADDAMIAPEMPAGENSITSRVTITYEVK